MTSKSAYSLREIESKDLELVLSWRNSDRIKQISFNDQTITKDEHLDWFRNLKSSSDKVCLIFEMNAVPIGVIQFKISQDAKKCHWSFYLGEENLPKGIGSIMGRISIEYAFSRFPIEQICGEAISHNESSIRFHEKLGFTKNGKIENQLLREGAMRDIYLFSLSRKDAGL